MWKTFKNRIIIKKGWKMRNKNKTQFGKNVYVKRNILEEKHHVSSEKTLCDPLWCCVCDIKPFQDRAVNMKCAVLYSVVLNSQQVQHNIKKKPARTEYLSGWWTPKQTNKCGKSASEGIVLCVWLKDSILCCMF